MDFDNAKSGTLHAALSATTFPILVRLLKEPIPEDVFEIAFTDLVEADFPGYSPQTLSSLDETDEDHTEIGEVISDVVAFSAADVIVPQGIFAWCITRERAGGGHDLWRLEPFAEVIVVDMAKQEIPLVIRVACCNDPT